MKYLLPLFATIILSACTYGPKTPDAPIQPIEPTATGVIDVQVVAPVNEMTVTSTGTTGVVTPTNTGASMKPIAKTGSTSSTGTVATSPEKTKEQEDKEVEDTMKDIDALFADIEKGN